jgi:hypothetical protein
MGKKDKACPYGRRKDGTCKPKPKRSRKKKK